MRIAVVVAWHGQHPEWLAQALASINAQTPRPDERCLVVDSPAESDPLVAVGYDPRTRGWVVRRGDWSDPAATRNDGLEATTSPWLIFWDGDNVMPPGFVRATVDGIARAGSNVGIVYPDLEYVDQNLRNASRWHVPDFDHWSLRAGNYIDTASAWRREAVELAGCWPRGMNSHEDYALALEITRRGWVARRRGGPPIALRQYPTSRSNERQRTGRRRDDMFDARSLGILTLLSGRTSTYDRWETFLRTAELPRYTSLYVVDNSGDPEFTRRVHATAGELGACGRYRRITVSVRPDRYGGREDEPYFVRERHLHIAALYADAVSAIGDDLLLTLEDDVEPPQDAVRRLVGQFSRDQRGDLAVVAAAYDMGADFLCAGKADGGWGSRIHWRELGDGAMDVGSVGGGCTLWANRALRGHPVLFRWQEGLGWDGSMCAALRARGFRVQLHGGVRATHHVHGTIRSA